MYFQDQAIILSSEPHRESDLLIKAYTFSHGKVILKARGAGKIQSKLAGHLQPISLSDLNWVSGKNTPQLTGAVMSSGFSSIKEDIVRTSYALYFLELVDLATQTEHADQKIFQLLASHLALLEKVPAGKIKLTGLIFTYKLLAVLGFSPLLKKEPSSTEYKILRQIISSPARDILALNISEKDTLSLTQDAEKYLAETFEVKIYSAEFLKKIK